VVKESHISVHTWPEHGYASVDVYTCGEADPWKVFNEIVHTLNPKMVSAVEIRRGTMGAFIPQSIVARERPKLKT